MASGVDTTETLHSNGLLSANAAAIRLVETIVWAEKTSEGDEGPDLLEIRAFETINDVFSMIGSRILEARMVDMVALTKALTTATALIETKLFSIDTKRVFRGLAQKLNDVTLVNNLFVSIYLVGFLCSELSSSLPNYKRGYPALGPLLIQQMVRVAVGEEAFRENLTANLIAHQTIASFAGLLLPTDISYSIFPGKSSLLPFMKLS